MNTVFVRPSWKKMVYISLCIVHEIFFSRNFTLPGTGAAGTPEVPVGPLVRGVDVGVAVGVDLGPVPVVGAPVLVVGIVLVPAEVPVGALVRCVDVGVAVGVDLGPVPVVGAPV